MAVLARAATRAARPVAMPARRVASPALRRMVVRAEAENKDVVMFGGESYTPEQWAEAKANGTLPQAEPAPAMAGAGAPAVSLGNLMEFGGAAPELINGRLAMLGVTAALAAEFATGESVLKQFAEEPTGIVVAFLVFIAASFVPLLAGKAPASQSLGPFNAAAEKLNGRAAMIGFASLLAIEAVKGSALF